MPSSQREAGGTSSLTAIEGGAGRAEPGAGPAPVVLQVLPALESGGVERGTIDMAAALSRAGWTSIVASAGGPMVHELERVGAQHVTLRLDTKTPLAVHENAGLLTALMYDHKVDIIHARSRAPAWSALLAARRSRAHLVTTFHGTYGAGNAIKRFYNSVMTKGQRVIAISDFIAGHVRQTYGIDDERLVTIPRGIDTRIFNPAGVSAERIIQLAKAWRLTDGLTDGLPVVMLPGRLTRWKGQTVLIEALAKLGRRDLRGVLVGGDQGRQRYRQELERMVSERGLGDVVRIVDHCRDMAAAYMLADVVVSASTDPEAFGRVSVEAQAMGRPVVVTNHGATRETMLPGRTGWQVPPDDPAALAAALDQALALDEAARRQMAETARAHVEAHFGVELMQSRTMELYQDLLQSRLKGVA
jgi:glycosyltransferase involved in cell wall biosynthesis